MGLRCAIRQRRLHGRSEAVAQARPAGPQPEGARRKPRWRARRRPGGLRPPPPGTAGRATTAAAARFPHPLPGETNASLEAEKEIYIKIPLMF